MADLTGRHALKPGLLRDPLQTVVAAAPSGALAGRMVLLADWTGLREPEAGPGRSPSAHGRCWCIGPALAARWKVVCVS